MGTVTDDRPGLLPFPADRDLSPCRRLRRREAWERRLAALDDIFDNGSVVTGFLALAPVACAVSASHSYLGSDAWDAEALRFPAAQACACIVLAAILVPVVLRRAWNRFGKPGRRALRLARAVVTALPLLLVAVAIPLGWFTAARTFAQINAVPSEKPWVAVLPSGEAIQVEGVYLPGMTARLRALLDANPGIRSLVLDSPGGLAVEGYAMAALIRERGLDTLAYRGCSSACSVAFVSGRRRSVVAWPGYAARIGFHSAGIGSLAVRDEEMRRIYLDAGLDPAFVEEAIGTAPESLLAPDPERLRQVGAIDAVAGRYDYPGLDWGPNADTPEEARRNADRDYWILPLLEGLDPGLVAEARDWLAAARAGGRNPGLIRDRLSLALSRAIAARLAVAPDRVLRRAALHLLSGMYAARGASSTDCRRIGGYADLFHARRHAPSPMGSASEPDRPYESLIQAAYAGGGPASWPDDALPAVGDPATWSERHARPVPAESCADLVAAYRSAGGFEDPEALVRLRGRMRDVAAGRVAVSSGS